MFDAGSELVEMQNSFETAIAVISTQAAPVATSSPSISQPMATVLSALIGAVAALVTLFLKDLLFDLLRERRAAKKSEREIYRRYLAPLVADCEKITWRGREIFVEGRHSFLKTATLPVEFNAYKRASTLFRIATLLGWVRAMALELNAIPRTSQPFESPVSKEIAALQGSLADGPHVERHRLERLSATWKISLDGLGETRRKQLAFRFENELHAAVGNRLRVDDDMLCALGTEEKLALSRRLATFLCVQAEQPQVSEDMLQATLDEAIQGLNYREALIYRDWQDALGDAMLEADADSPRRYKTIGYEAFQKLLDEATMPWVKALKGSIDDLDFDEIDPSDFRTLQLTGVVGSAAGILVRISATEERDLVSAELLGAAQELLEAVAPARPRLGRDQ